MYSSITGSWGSSFLPLAGSVAQAPMTKAKGKAIRTLAARRSIQPFSETEMEGSDPISFRGWLGFFDMVSEIKDS
jgi:hypothetical protein